jgi:predicted solute-binding protein
MAKRLGIIAQAYAQPLFAGLKNRRDNLFTLTPRSSAELALALRQHQLDGAFLSPIDYAKDYAMYRIVPEVAAVSRGESHAALLVFKDSARQIASVAVDPRSSSEIVLASVILAEKYDLHPTLIPVAGTLGEALGKADAAIVVGDTARTIDARAKAIDLVDEWDDITGLPFVHGFWVSRESAFERAELRAIIASLERPPTKDPLQPFDYLLGEEAAAGIDEFFRMAYFHQILDDITDVKFHRLEPG